MLVLRIESKKDMWEGGIEVREKCKGCWSILPTPSMDIHKPTGGYYKEDIKKNEVCSTKSIPQLRKWFPSIKQLPRTHHAVILDVPNNSFTKLAQQTLIKRDKAKIVGYLTPDFQPVFTRKLKHSFEHEKELIKTRKNSL